MARMLHRNRNNKSKDNISAYNDNETRKSKVELVDGSPYRSLNYSHKRMPAPIKDTNLEMIKLDLNKIQNIQTKGAQNKQLIIKTQ